ncbi:hypothetical protein FLAG1_08185 [Fusarium langsethiae]|uniref:Uncharacterized protein n=1 Tax=Fusarium langsethiae TaxID=179993 RepID=A0A0N1J2G6_FUSLA|nr:hypothetical protein FLAG1_08185 [Fusarium langsethiae]GKU07762.1 unnamed protein product [Fusarium langsethiae]GKU08961.1 unnamed protein product [Fusarium langsethiae]
MCNYDAIYDETQPAAGEDRILVDFCDFRYVKLQVLEELCPTALIQSYYGLLGLFDERYLSWWRGIQDSIGFSQHGTGARLITELQDNYEIIHVDNCQSINEVIPKVTEHKPDVLFSASMWSPEEAQQIHAMAKSIVPDIKLHAIPTGLQVERGPDAIVEYLVEKVPALLDS